MRLVLIPLLAACFATVTEAQPSPARAPKFPPPANDMFTNAQVQTGYGWYAYGQTRGATHEKGDAGSATVWYSWTAPASGPALVNIWDQKKPLGSFNVLTGTNVTKLKAVKPLVKRNRLNLLFGAQMGTTYYFEINKPSGFKLDEGSDFTLQLTLTTLAITSPTNGLAIKSSQPVPLSIVTTEDPSLVASVKYYMAGVPRTLIGEADTPPYSATWTNPVPGNPSVYAELTRTDGYVLDTASPRINVRPYNDDFADRATLTGTNINLSANDDNQTLEPGEPAANFGGSVWYEWTAPTDGEVFVQHHYPPFGSAINVFTGDSLASLQLISSDEVPFHVNAGEKLEIAVLQLGSLSMRFWGTPPNDDLASATQISGTNTVLTGNSMGATLEPGEPTPEGTGGHSVWFDWVAPTNGTLILADTNSPVIITDGGRLSPFVITLYSGDSVTNLTAVSTNGLMYPAYIPVLGGTNYHIRVDNGSTNSGLDDFLVTLAFAPAQPNDGFADRTVLTGNDVYFNYSTVGASTEPGEPDNGPNSLWYTWTAPYDGTAMVSGIQYSSAQGHAYTGDSLTNLTFVAAKDAYFFWPAQAGQTYQIVITSGWPGKVFDAGLHLHYYTNGTPIEP